MRRGAFEAYQVRRGTFEVAFYATITEQFLRFSRLNAARRLRSLNRSRAVSMNVAVSVA